MRMITFRIIFAVLLPLWVLPVWAQGKMDFYRGTVNVLHDKILPRLIDHLPHGERQKLADIGLELIPNPTVVTTVFTPKNTKKIYIFVGFMDGLFQYIDCLLMDWKKTGRVACNRYFDYYFEHIVLKKPDPPLSFAEFVLIEGAKVDNWYSDKRIDRARNMMFIGAFINIIMHEMGHHVVGFAEPGMNVSRHRDLEIRVDRWSIDRLAQMNENPVLGAVVAFGYLSQIERFRRIKGATSFSLHPMPHDRARYAYKRGCANLAGDMASKACGMLHYLIHTFE